MIGRAIVLVIASLQLNPVLHAQPRRWTSIDDFARKVEAAALANSLDADKFRQAQNSVAIVFVPGVLGSELIRGTKTVWGSGEPNVLELALPVGGIDNNVHARILGEFSLFWGYRREDVYKGFLDAVETARGGRGSFQEFPYDWRLDIRKNAQRLDEFLTSNKHLEGKSIIIIGHSMGGVVTWYWQNRFFRMEKGGPRVRRLLLVGAPLLGSCEMVRMLVAGYQDIPGAGMMSNWIYSKLFNDLRPAAFTFPGVFQLLPRVPLDPSDTDKSCLDVPAEVMGDFLAADYFDINFWRSSFGRFALERVSPPWKVLTQGNQNAFFEGLEKVLKVAKEFRGELDLDDLKIPTMLFYATQHQTALKGRSRRVGERYEIDFPFMGPGDGRVGSESASNESMGQNPRRKKWRLDLTHGELPKDKRFISYLTGELSRTIRAEQVLSYARLLISNPAIFDRYYRAGGREVAETSVSADLEPDLQEEVTRVVRAVNKLVQERAPLNITYYSVKESQKKITPTDAPLNRSLIPQLEQLLVTPGAVAPEQTVFVYGRLGFAHFYGQNYKAAVPQLREAYAGVQNLSAAKRVEPNVSEFISSVTGLLGTALARTGRCTEAMPYLIKGIELGNKTARGLVGTSCVEAASGTVVLITP